MCFAGGLLNAQDRIQFYDSKTIVLSGVSIQKYLPVVKDTITWDTLYQVRATNNFPVSYFRRVEASVCFDNKCRLLKIILHWNVTGRYLGFELPSGEYLSKAEHKPFVQSEYEKMHSILMDEGSPLGNFYYNELVPQNVPSQDIDAVSSPTAKNLLEFVVEGAAFTTYKLWHIVHGNTRDEVSRLTSETLSPDLLLAILNSTNLSDRIWALNHRTAMNETNPQVEAEVLRLVRSADYNLAERAIQSVTPLDLASHSFQVALLKDFDNLNYAIRKMIVLKFRAAPELSPEVSIKLAEKLQNLSGELIGSILDLFFTKEVNDIEISKRVARLLKNANFYISRQAYEFLNRLQIADKDVQRSLSSYRSEHNLH